MNPTGRDSHRRFIERLAAPARRRLILLSVLASAAAGLPLLPAPALAQDAGFTCGDRSGGSAAQTQAALTSVRFSQHDGYDRIVFGFANALSVPAYRLTQQSSATFVQGGSGTPRTLAGSAGLRTAFSGTFWTAGVPLSDARPGLPVIREVAAVENFEGVTAYGVGLSYPACLRITELSSPSRLVIDFAAPPGQAAATVDQPLAASSSSPASAPAEAEARVVSNQALARTSAGLGLPIAATGAALLALGLVLVAWRRLRTLRGRSI